MATVEHEEIAMQPYTVERHFINGKEYEVVILPREDLDDPADFGKAFCGDDIAYVRLELPAPVRTFVTYHELYHLIDTRTWGGWWGSELRANVVAGICHPIGFMWCIWLTLSIPERRELYKRRFKNKF